MDNYNMDPAETFYRIGSQIYSAADQQFVAEAPQDKLIDLVPATVENLVATLRFYNQPVGSCLMAIEELRMEKLAELARAFEEARQTATVATPDGWPADANEVAYRNVQGLLITMENMGGTSVSFCDANNEFHGVNQQELQAIQQLIIDKGLALYQRKWQLRAAINNAETREALNGIAISFA